MKKQNIKKILIRLLKKFYYTFISRYIDGKIKYLNRHKNYKEYIQKQIEKTNDPEKIARWQGSEWSIKVDGFNNSDEFEKFVNEATLKANSMLKTNDPKRFAYKYGENVKQSALVKQT